MLIKNTYIEDQESNTVRDIFDKYFEKNFLLVSLKTGINGTYKDIDIFQYFDQDTLDKVLNQKYYLIIELKDEGFTNRLFHIFDMIYYNCKKYNKNVNEIIYISSNLRDTNVLEKYCKKNNTKPFHVIPISFFELVDVEQRNFLFQFKSTEQELKNTIKQTKNFYINKLFSSLSRQNRSTRTYSTFLLCQSDISKHALISHDVISEEIYNIMIESFVDLDEKETFDQWCKTLPLVADRSDFDNNWAMPQYDFSNIHNSTIFQIVNETFQEDWKKTSLFYSEKTFRPILCMQPFVINGQQGCNKYLSRLGYKTYDEWFNLSFDHEPDPVLRYKKLLKSVEDTVKYLKSLNRDRQIEWRFKNKEILKHNLNVMIQKTNCEKVLIDYIKKLNN